MAQRGRPRGDRIVIVTPKGKPGRPRFKPCAHAGCGHGVAYGARYCPKHCAAILAALRDSAAYRTDDLRRGVRQIATETIAERASEL